MKQSSFLGSYSSIVPSKKTVVKKLLSTVLATAAMTGVTILFTAVKLAPSLSEREVAQFEEEGESSRGLSRSRGAFNYAIDLLADASEADPELANYYHGVERRLKGRHARTENSSGIRVFKPERRVNTSALGTENAQGRMTVGKSLLAVLANAVNLAKGPVLPSVAVLTSIPDASNLAPPAFDDALNVASRFTTGDITFDENPAIEYWMNYYLANPVGRRTMTIGIERSGDYLEMAREEFKKAGVPEDLVWLAFVESVWNPKAVSPAAAGGIWQFIRPTATDYGLKVESGNDERADPLKQTKVAAIYLRDLYTIFGDWALAMAAYNSGEPRVMGAIVKNGRADFWDLCDKQLLPRETRDYVPKILAAIKVASRAQEYGLTSPISTANSRS